MQNEHIPSAQDTTLSPGGRPTDGKSPYFEEQEIGGSKIITLAFCTAMLACFLVLFLAFGHLRPQDRSSATSHSSYGKTPTSSSLTQKPSTPHTSVRQR